MAHSTMAFSWFLGLLFLFLHHFINSFLISRRLPYPSPSLCLPADHNPTSFFTCSYSALGREIRKSHLFVDVKNSKIF